MSRRVEEKSPVFLHPRIRTRLYKCGHQSRRWHPPKCFCIMIMLSSVLALPRASAAATRRFEESAMVLGIRIPRQDLMAYVPSSFKTKFDTRTCGVHYFPLRLQRPKAVTKGSVILQERSYNRQIENDLAQPQMRTRKTKRPMQLPTKESNLSRQRSTTPHRNTVSHQARNPSRQKSTPKLETPQIIFSNNHLLVCNKPPGWKSQPGDGGGKSSSSQSNNNNNNVDPKCLLTYLQSQQLGGGSLQNFLIPTHRLDQPCTGVLIFAKNGKAASRVQVAWGKRQVEKEYWVVVEGGAAGGGTDGLEVIRYQSKKLNEEGVFRLSALIQTKPPNGRNAGGKSSNAGGGGSVSVKPIPRNYNPKDESNTGNGRVCHIEWRHLLALPTPSAPSSSRNDPRIPTRHLLSVKTDTGAKHQVRALLALAGDTPIAGDLRYGNNLSGRGGGRVDGPLPDGSVALHARSVFMPTVSLGGMEFLKDEPFVADIPNKWMDFFGICEGDVKGL